MTKKLKEFIDNKKDMYNRNLISVNEYTCMIIGYLLALADNGCIDDDIFDKYYTIAMDGIK